MKVVALVRDPETIDKLMSMGFPMKEAKNGFIFEILDLENRFFREGRTKWEISFPFKLIDTDLFMQCGPGMGVMENHSSFVRAVTSLQGKKLYYGQEIGYAPDKAGNAFFGRNGAVSVTAYNRLDGQKMTIKKIVIKRNMKGTILSITADTFRGPKEAMVNNPKFSAFKRTILFAFKEAEKFESQRSDNKQYSINPA